MNTVRVSATLAWGALVAALASLSPTPASADPMVIPAQDYAPSARAPRYYDEYTRPMRRSEARGYRRDDYAEDLFDDPSDRVYRYEQPRRIPSARERRATIDGQDVRTRRYYGGYGADDPRDEPYESRDPVVDPQPRRYAGPPSGAGGDQPMRRSIDPKFARAIVPYKGSEPAHSIVIDTRTRYLYLIQGDGTAIRYGVGVGKEGFTWKGTQTIANKKEWPDWRPPAEMRQRRPELPVMMAGGPDNPLGARAMYLGNTLYRIHGSNEPWTIGHAVSSGCIRMTNEDVMDLYERVKIGTIVKVI